MILERLKIARTDHLISKEKESFLSKELADFSFFVKMEAY